jgi:class I fructose-bisphosphate aldolase
MNIKQERLRRIFNNSTGNTVVVPIDHGVFGVQQHLEDPVLAFERFAKLDIDAVLVNFGLLKLIKERIGKFERPIGAIMTVDYNHVWSPWKKPIDETEIIGHCRTATVEQAVKYNADAVKVFFALGLEKDLQLQVMKNVADVISEADKYDMPVMVEPTTDGRFISPEHKNDPKIIADGCRIAMELGADILKVPYPYGKPNGKETFESVCANSHLPVIMLGGPKKDTVRDILNIARDGVDAGARGTIFGRNVWQRPVDEAARVIHALQDIVHHGAGVKQVMDNYNLK